MPENSRGTERRDAERRLDSLLKILNGPKAYGLKANLLGWARFPYEAEIPQQRGFSEKYRTELQKCIDTFLAAGQHFGRWQQQNPTLAASLDRTAERIQPKLLPSSESGAALLTFIFKTSAPTDDVPRETAHADFQEAVVNPYAENLRRCDRCGKYFLNRSGHQNKKYCTRKCAQKHTAEKSTRERRAAERNQKIERATAAIQRFDRLKSKPHDWKAWVAKRSGNSKKWLTRALNTGALREPVLGNGSKHVDL